MPGLVHHPLFSFPDQPLNLASIPNEASSLSSTSSRTSSTYSSSSSHSRSETHQRNCSYLNTPMNSKPKRTSLIGSIKNKLPGNRDSDRNSNNPFGSSPATRRPGKLFRSSNSPQQNRLTPSLPDRPGMNAFTTPSTEPPPPYTAAAGSSTMPGDAAAPQFMHAGPSTGQSAADVTDDQYSFLKTFDTVFLIDDSGSMAGRNWRECSSALEAITPICTAYDADGIDIFFLNAPDMPVNHNVKEALTIHEIFSTVRPGGGTPTGQTLNRILKAHLKELEAHTKNPSAAPVPKPMNIIVITDGVPSDDVESVLVRAAQKLDHLDAEPWQLGVQFFQVGNEWGATEHLEGLDDDLSRMGKGCRDIVDTVPFKQGNGGLTAEKILKIVLGAVNKRLDRRRNA
ncbi:MAG: hypothetical protein M1831_001882 [Alyxoria varia]|nr:MAG: hypothetical protein M1831_001882 [Alyxoria varia]